MKNIILFIIAIMLFTGCADNKTIENKEYRPYGLVNEEDCKNDSILYRVSYPACISGVLFSEFFLIPTI